MYIITRGWRVTHHGEHIKANLSSNGVLQVEVPKSGLQEGGYTKKRKQCTSKLCASLQVEHCGEIEHLQHVDHRFTNAVDVIEGLEVVALLLTAIPPWKRNMVCVHAHE